MREKDLKQEIDTDAVLLDDKRLYELVREQYNKVNKEYLEEQRQKVLQYQKCSQCRHFVYDADCLEIWMCERLHEGKDCKFEVYERY